MQLGAGQQGGSCITFGREEDTEYEENISAQEAPQKEGARLYEENVYKERQKGFSS